MKLRYFAAALAVLLTAPIVNVTPASAITTRRLYRYDTLLKWNGQAPPIKANNTGPVFAELHRCFNCSFPVSGAPSKYPSTGQFIALKACYIPGFACLNAPIKAYPDDAHSRLTFIAQPGHFDGAGSVLTFIWSRDSKAQLHLTVTGDVVSPSIPDAVNAIAAQQTWGQFAQRLALNIVRYQPGCADNDCR